MSSSNWTADLLNQLIAADITVEQINLPSITLWQIESNHWQQFAELAIQQNVRWVAGWAEHVQGRFFINACFEKQGVYVLLRTIVNIAKPELPSQATVIQLRIAVSVILRICSALIL
jgi:hypothetical protein